MNPYRSAIVLILLLSLISCSGNYSVTERGNIKKTFTPGNVSVHDPSVVVADGRYYIFGSHMDSAVSDDLMHWTRFTQGVSPANPLFSNLFAPDRGAFRYVGRNDQGSWSVWAPDVIYNPAMGKWMMYFCTTSSYIKSNLCFALSDSAEGPYAYQDTILYSGFTRQTVDQTNVEEVIGEGNFSSYLDFGNYNNSLWPNAIDPALFHDREGRLWMVYGSWSGGVFILEIDRETGYPIHPAADDADGTDSYFGKHLAGGYHNSVEGPYVIYDEASGYYYLFVSYGGLVSNGGYQIRLYRSENPDGPYVDKRGESLDFTKADHREYGVKLMGNYSFPSLTMAYMAPGHNSAMINDEGDIYLVHHTRFDDGTEYHEPRVRRLFRTDDGWLTAAPFAYNQSEARAEGYRKTEIAGYYYTVNHGTDIGPEIREAAPLFFKANGMILSGKGGRRGSWSYDSASGAVSLVLGGSAFEGVLLTGKDESGNDILAITALSDRNESLWGVHYK
ncbi:MAG: glycoside hydrolase family 43 protein [Spirochaetales bacterium]|nr:glycoside hydrolase family 43 protein [Spirochaetales bacterium]